MGHFTLRDVTAKPCLSQQVWLWQLTDSILPYLCDSLGFFKICEKDSCELSSNVEAEKWAAAAPGLRWSIDQCKCLLRQRGTLIFMVLTYWHSRRGRLNFFTLHEQRHNSQELINATCAVWLKRFCSRGSWHKCWRGTPATSCNTYTWGGVRISLTGFSFMAQTEPLVTKSQTLFRHLLRRKKTKTLPHS